MRRGLSKKVTTIYKLNKSDPIPADFFILDIGNGYELKYDPYRKDLLWTLLRKNGGRVLDGDFMDVVIFLYEKEILGWAERKEELTHCPECGRLLLGANKICIKCDYV